MLQHCKLGSKPFVSRDLQTRSLIHYCSTLSIVLPVNASIELAVPNNSVVEMKPFIIAIYESLPSIPLLASNLHDGGHFVTSPNRDVAFKGSYRCMVSLKIRSDRFADG
jgi:hypothetical protein